MEPFGNMQSEENDKVVLLYKLYYKQMLYAAKQIMRDHCEAENAVQEEETGRGMSGSFAQGRAMSRPVSFSPPFLPYTALGKLPSAAGRFW